MEPATKLSQFQTTWGFSLKQSKKFLHNFKNGGSNAQQLFDIFALEQNTSKPKEEIRDILLAYGQNGVLTLPAFELYMNETRDEFDIPTDGLQRTLTDHPSHYPPSSPKNCNIIIKDINPIINIIHKKPKLKTSSKPRHAISIFSK